MAYVIDFKLAMEKLHQMTEKYATSRGDIHVTEKQDARDAEVMSRKDNWCCVRTTDQKPLYDQDGNIVLPSLAMISDCEIARNTVHTVLNHVVESHSEGNWDSFPYVIFAPYKSIVAKNGQPVGLDLVDTYFSTDADTGLVLPKEAAYVVQPTYDRDAELYTIGKNGATYKADYFTEDEIARILSLLEKVSPKDFKEYNRLSEGLLTKEDIQKVLGNDLRAKRWYDEAKTEEAKRKFLSGLIQEDRYVILTKFLRNAVVRMAMKEKGFQYIEDANYRSGVQNYGEYNSQVAKAVEDVAINEEIETGSWRHAYSLYGLHNLQQIFEGFRTEIDSVVSTTNMDELFTKMYKLSLGYQRGFRKEIELISAIVGDRFPDDYYDTLYESAFADYKRRQLAAYNDLGPEYRKRYGYMYINIQKYKTLEEFDPKFAKVLKRNINVNLAKLRNWRKQMEQNPKFQKLLSKWKMYMASDYTNEEEFLKPSIEQDVVQKTTPLYQLNGHNH